jgi:hypothetical protein
MIGSNSDFVRVGQWTFNVHHISSIRNLENNTNGKARVSLVSGEVIYLSEDELRTLEKAITLQQSNTRALMGR